MWSSFHWKCVRVPVFLTNTWYCQALQFLLFWWVWNGNSRLFNVHFPYYWWASFHVFISLSNFLFCELSICILCDLFFSIELYFSYNFIYYLLVIVVKICILLVYHLSFVFDALCHGEDFQCWQNTCACECVCTYVHARAYIHTYEIYRLYIHFMLRFLFFKYGTFILFFFSSMNSVWIVKYPNFI